MAANAPNSSSDDDLLDGVLHTQYTNTLESVADAVRHCAALVEAELDAHLVPDGDRWRYRYCRSAAVAAWSEMARPAVTPPPGTPTLLVPATRADFVSDAWVADCRAALGDDLVVAPVDSGHMVFLERTAEVATAIRGFL